MNAAEVVVLSGGFAPLHFAHVRMMQAAKDRGAHVVVGVNSDAWLVRKKGGLPPFMPFEERREIVAALACVDEAVGFDDADGTACSLIRDVVERYGERGVPIYFGNGGDRVTSTTPEVEMCEGPLSGSVGMLWELGGVKLQSSSDLLGNWVEALKRHERY